MEQFYAVTVYDPDDAKEFALFMMDLTANWPYTYVNEAGRTIILGYGNAYEEAKDWLEAHAFGKWNVLVVKTTQKEYGPGHPAAVQRDPIEVLGELHPFCPPPRRGSQPGRHPPGKTASKTSSGKGGNMRKTTSTKHKITGARR